MPGPHPCLRSWLAQDAVEVGEKPWLTKAEREELVRLRCENRGAASGA
jgi:hypothetical protein